ncbi:hypothetical protein ACQE3E_06585 [Methylomonas sp. MED-D]|uniref:hypothetical protein n=1 Tax=Methylomonas sp. MED-D TaxID=3418768 RepID=UPI003CFD169C
MLGRLAAGAVDFGRVGGSSAPALQAVEFAGYLRGLGEAATLVALAKYMGDAAALRRLGVVHAAWVSAREWVGVDDVDRAQRIAALSLSELVDDKCPRCHGTRFVRAKSCPACDGSGVRRISGRQMAVGLGVSEASWRRVWIGRYGEALSRLRGLESEVNQAVARIHWREIEKGA